MDQQWVTLVSQVSFPILITLWFMFRLERRWDLLLELMTQEAAILKIIHDYITRQKGRRKDYD
jgi:hypothetical protein